MIRSKNFDYYYQTDLDPFPERIPIALERLEWFYDTVAHLFTTQKLFCFFNNCRLSTFWLEGIAMYYTWPLVCYCDQHNTIHQCHIGTWYGQTVHYHARDLLLKGKLMSTGPCIYGNEHFDSVGYRCSYPAAGSFITFLLEPGQNSPDKIKKLQQFFQLVNFASSREEAAHTFSEIFGSTIEEVEEDWHQFFRNWSECQIEPRCDYGTTPSCPNP